MARTSYTIVYRILDDDGETAAEATTLLAVVDAESGRPMRMSEALRERLSAAS